VISLTRGVFEGSGPGNDGKGHLKVSSLINPATSLFWALWPKNISDLPEAKLNPNKRAGITRKREALPLQTGYLLSVIRYQPEASS
jgi:hypothetical protein